MGLSKNDAGGVAGAVRPHRAKATRNATRQKNGRSRRPSSERVQLLNYQAATTAPLNFVSMNCFTAGL